jgi:hypothetical protein
MFITKNEQGAEQLLSKATNSLVINLLEAEP